MTTTTTAARPNKLALWAALSHYDFAHLVPSNMTDRVLQVFGGKNASLLAFATKVAKKHGWKVDFAVRAVEEYKKFVYLGVISTTPVTPSKIIDVVWHEHILFTHGYRAFCDEVIRYSFDHNPELVPERGQTASFRKQFIATLALYRKEFGTEPPADIWSAPKFDDEEEQRERGGDGTGRSDTSNLSSSDDTPLYLLLQNAGDSSPGSHGSHHSGGKGHSATDSHEAPQSDSHGSHGTPSNADGGNADTDGGTGGEGGCSSGCGGGCGGGGD